MEDLNNTINQVDLTETNRTHHPITARYMLFSSDTKHSPDHMLDHKTIIDKCKRTEIIQNMFFEQKLITEIWHITKS